MFGFGGGVLSGYLFCNRILVVLFCSFQFLFPFELIGFSREGFVTGVLEGSSILVSGLCSFLFRFCVLRVSFGLVPRFFWGYRMIGGEEMGVLVGAVYRLNFLFYLFLFL